jgi:hypothetical protein
LFQNLREAIEKQLGGLCHPTRRLGGETAAGSGDDSALFAEVKALYAAGCTVTDIVRKLGLKNRRRVDKWIRLEMLPSRNVMAPKLCTPVFYQDHLKRRWAEGVTKCKWLFSEIKGLGYTGSFSHLARLLSSWRRQNKDVSIPAALVPPETKPTVPMSATGPAISPLVAAALCMKPRPMLTIRQSETVDALKVTRQDFATMRALAMKFRGVFHGSCIEKLDEWIQAARQSGVYAMQRFARRLVQDLMAVRAAVTEPWSNGQTEGQINRLKMLKRAMYGRAGVDLLRARMLPPPPIT